MSYLGDFAEDATVRFMFTTHAQSGAPAAPSSAFEAADLVIYKDGSATQKATTNGVTMTSPFDSTTGLHAVAIDTSNDTGDTGFWAAGSDYTVVLAPDETVDGVAVVKVIAQFSIANRLPGMLAIGEESIDQSNPAQWQQVVKKRGTSTVLLRNDLFEADGVTPITSTTQIVGARLEP